MLRASPPRLEEKQPRAIFRVACTVMLQSTVLYSKEHNSWIYKMTRGPKQVTGMLFLLFWHSFKVEQMIADF